MATTLKYLRGGTLETWLNTAATLTNNSLAISAAITITDAGYVLADVEFAGTFAVAPTANTGVSLWLLREVDGTNYEDGDASTTPGRAPDAVFPVRTVTTAQRIIRQCLLPPGTFKVLAKNDATGQTISSGWTIKGKDFTLQQV